MRRMRKASAIAQDGRSDEIRATFLAPRSLVDEFRLIAKRRERSMSAELRRLIADEVRKDSEAA